MRKISLFLITLFYSCLLGVNTAGIDAVRSKETLSEGDREVIEEFLKEAFQELLEKTDFSDVSALRNAIITRSTSKTESGQFQYGPIYSQNLEKQIKSAFAKAATIQPGERKSLLIMNLLILISDINNLELTKLALDYVENPELTVRYWAVYCVTNNNILGLFNNADATGSKIAEQTAQKLLKISRTEQSGDILILIAQFAAGLKQPIGNDILTEIVANRINLYSSWKVKDEMTDSWILKALSERADTDRADMASAAKNFAILYSFMIQRYIHGEDTLSPNNTKTLISAILQGEKYLTKFLPDWAGNIKRAIEKGDRSLLTVEHDALLGSANTVGKLPSAAGFDYGKNPDGSAKTAPPVLEKTAD